VKEKQMKIATTKKRKRKTTDFASVVGKHKLRYLYYSQEKKNRKEGKMINGLTWVDLFCHRCM